MASCIIKVANFQKKPASYSPSWLQIKVDNLKQKLCWLLSPTGRPLLTRKFKDQDMTQNSCRPISNLSVLRLTNPTLGKEDTSEALKFLEKRLEPSAYSVSPLLCLLFCVTASCVCFLKLNEFFICWFLSSAVLRFLCCYLLHLKFFLSFNSLIGRKTNLLKTL